MDHFKTPPIIHKMYIYTDIHLTYIYPPNGILVFQSYLHKSISRQVTLVFSKITFGRLIANSGSGSKTHLAYLRRKRAGKENEHHGKS